MAQSNPLRALIQRLTSTPVENLPSIAYFLASSISRCLVSPQNPGTDRTALLHKLKARISSLLQDRAPEGRFSAVVVAKAVIEAGGREILVDLEPWIRGLIGILNKSDPVATKRLAILTVSRALILTQRYPSIVREVTTPLLPAFNTACLAAIRPKTTKTDKGTQNILSPLLSTMLQCWNELLPQHAPTFRPFITRFRPICLSLLSDATTPDNISRSAGALLVALHHSAPKNAAATEWSQMCQDTIQAAHATASSLFRSICEDWTPADSGSVYTADSLHLNGEHPGGGPDVLGLAEWRGMHDGAQRLSRLLDLLEVSVSAATGSEVSIPLGGIMDLCARLLALTIPGAGKDSPYTLKPNSEFGKDEREMLWSEIPTVHVQCLRLLRVVVEVLQHAILPISKSIIEQLTWLLDVEHDLPDIRASSYELLKVLLPTLGPTATDIEVKKISGLIHHACRDLLLSAQSTDNDLGKEKVAKTVTVNTDAFMGPDRTGSEQTMPAVHSDLEIEAINLISGFLQYVPAYLIANTLRTEIDRTAILIQNKQTLLASVLNPATAQKGQHPPASLLPFFAQADLGLEAEALLRPRMAVIIDKQAEGASQNDADSETEEMVEKKNPTNGNGLLDRHGEALEAPGAVEVVGNMSVDGSEALAAAESDQAIGDGITLNAAKRDFGTMNGNGLSGGHMAGASMTQIVDTETKKARIDDNGLAAPSFGHESLVEDEPTINGAVENDVETSAFVPKQPIVEVEPQPTVKSVLKGKGPVIGTEDSDSDIPEINVEPDTDEEEDEDDDMYG